MKAIENREKKDLQCKYSSRLAGKTSLISEKEYQRFVMQYLEENNGFVIRNSKLMTVCMRLTGSYCSHS